MGAVRRAGRIEVPTRGEEVGRVAAAGGVDVEAVEARHQVADADHQLDVSAATVQTNAADRRPRGVPQRGDGVPRGGAIGVATVTAAVALVTV